MIKTELIIPSWHTCKYKSYCAINIFRNCEGARIRRPTPYVCEIFDVENRYRREVSENHFYDPDNP